MKLFLDSAITDEIKKYYNNKIFLYFHNDPLTMSGSSSISDRLYLLENVDKIIFNSKWSRDRFFLNLDKYELLLNKSIVIFPILLIIFLLLEYDLSPIIL